MADYSDIAKKIQKAQDELKDGQAIDLSGLVGEDGKVLGHVRRIAAPKGVKGVYRGAKKWVGNSNFISNNYASVAFAADNGLIDRGLKATFSAEHGRGEVKKTPGKDKPESKSRTLKDAVADARRDGKLVNVSDVQWVTHGTGDKAYEKLQGYRTIKPFGEKYSGSIVGVNNSVIVSNNYDAFKLAADEIGQPRLAEQYWEQHEKLRGGRPAKRSPGVRKVKEGPKGPLSPKKGGDPGLWLEKLYLEADGEGNYLDVSQLNENGTGAKIIKKSAKPRGQLTRVTATGTDEGERTLVSNNYEKYLLATQLLGPNFAEWADVYLREHGAGKMVRPAAQPKASPKGKRPVYGKYQGSRSPVRSRGRSASPSSASSSNSVRRLSQERAASRSRERLLQAELAEERAIERSLEKSLERARSASGSRSPVRSAGRSASPKPAARIPLPRRTMATQAAFQTGR